MEPKRYILDFLVPFSRFSNIHKIYLFECNFRNFRRAELILRLNDLFTTDLTEIALEAQKYYKNFITAFKISKSEFPIRQLFKFKKFIKICMYSSISDADELKIIRSHLKAF